MLDTTWIKGHAEKLFSAQDCLIWKLPLSESWWVYVCASCPHEKKIKHHLPLCFAI